jgi:adenine-specific DNA-methyltransferase
MRYIGNKTKLLSFIRDALGRRRISGGVAIDPFSGTASVAAELKRLRFRVLASDVMEYGYVFAHAYVQVDASHVALTGELEQRLALLNAMAGRSGFIREHYTPGGDEGRRHQRMFYTPENGARIDAIRATLHRWRSAGEIDDDVHALLLASLLEAADRVANTTGVYAACVKSWQPNARKPLRLLRPGMTPGNGCRAARGDAVDIVAAHEPFELLYLDPPYNGRQYTGYYHIPELIATGWFDAAIEPRGKTGLVTDPAKRSDWSRRARCEAALEALVARARCQQIVMSYNSEGLIEDSAIERIFRAYGRRATFRRYRRVYKRYRSDRDGAGRRYRGDEVTEYLYCVSR